MIRPCTDRDFEVICAIINDAAQKYQGIIPQDCWKVPYMPAEELRNEIDQGVNFWGFEESGKLVGVMGIQHVKDVTLIRRQGGPKPAVVTEDELDRARQILQEGNENE